MTRHAPTEDLETFVRRQDAPTLAAVLLDLAATHEPVKDRLLRLQMADRPDRLAATFGKTLDGLRRQRGGLFGREAREFGRLLETWLDQVTNELLPRDPPAALALFERFIASDASFFEAADDSYGSIGDAVRAGCRCWLQAAARCETPASEWPPRLRALFEGDEYGARDELLREAGLLLAPAALRELVAHYEAQLRESLAREPAAERQSSQSFSAKSALSLLAKALHDPDVDVRATILMHPDPAPHLRQRFVRDYLDADRPADALGWLEGTWGDAECTRRDLLAETLERLGRYDESLPLRQAAFEATLSVFALGRWLAHLPEAQSEAARARARELALGHGDPAVAATLLLELGHEDDAEAVLVAHPERLDGGHDPALVPLAERLRNCGLPRGETAVLRALLTAVLSRANWRAYGHAARYWARLGEIAGTAAGLLPLEPHDGFVAAVRSRHARKTSFWAHVRGERRDGGDDD